MDNHPSICQIGRYRWTAIRLYTVRSDIGGCCPSTYSWVAHLKTQQKKLVTVVVEIFMSENEEIQPNTSVPKWEKLKNDLEELDRLYRSKKQQDNFEYALINVSKKNQIDSEDFRKIFNEYHIEKNKIKIFDDWCNKTPFFSLLQRLTTIAGVIALIYSVVTFLPTQQQQRRTETERKNIERDRSHYEAWGIINNNRVNGEGILVKTSSGRITALENLNKDRVPLQRIELAETFLSSVDLSGADLYRANFRGADLYRANFSSQSRQVNPFECFVLSWTKLVDCKSKEELQERGTDLQRASFDGAILYDVKFNAPKTKNKVVNKRLGVNLFRADFRPFYIRKFTSGEIDEFKKSKDPLKQETRKQRETCGTKPTEIDCMLSVYCGMEDRIIQCARPVNAKFIGANLKDADFTKADLKGSDFEDSDLECVTFRGATFNILKRLDSLDLPEGIPPTNFKNANLKGADFRDVVDLSPSQIKQAVDWQKAKYSPFLEKELGLSPQNKPFVCKAYEKEPIRYPA
jgi:uncharacterized protein YjbI with pentapeptide repeats